MAGPLPSAPRIAVLLAVHNGVAWLPEQLESILGQTGVAVSVFCSVDASAFDSVGFADQDDLWLADKLQRAQEAMRSSGADGYSGNVAAFWPDGRKALIEKNQPQARWDFLFEAAGPGCAYVLSQRLATALQDLIQRRGDEVRQVGLHDWFAYAFAHAHGHRWLIDDHVGMHYRQHEDNQVGVNTGVHAFARRVRVVLSGWGLAQSALIADLTGMGDDPFVKHWASGSRWGLLWLATHAGQCRRRGRDKLLFAGSCLMIAVVGR